MKYSEYYKILHSRNKYNVKYLADFLSFYFPLSAIDYDSSTRTFSVPRSLVAALSDDCLNRLSRTISAHAYYDAFLNDKLVICPLFPRKRTI